MNSKTKQHHLRTDNLLQWFKVASMGQILEELQVDFAQDKYSQG